MQPPRQRCQRKEKLSPFSRMAECCGSFHREWRRLPLIGGGWLGTNDQAMKNPQIEYAVFGSERFSESELRLLRIDLDHATRYARLLKHFLAQPGANRRTVAELAAGLAVVELGIGEPQVVCEILPGEHPGKRGFARIVPNDHRIFIQFEDACACTIAITVAHECRHRWQMINKHFIEMCGRGESEPDAERFAASTMRKHHFTCGDCGKTY